MDRFGENGGFRYAWRRLWMPNGEAYDGSAKTGTRYVWRFVDRMIISPNFVILYMPLWGL